MPDGSHVIVIAGPNGAGKSTVGPRLLRGALSVTEFVNADTIARGLSAFNPDAIAIQAGRIMLGRLRQLAAAGADFAFETTLASRSFGPWLQELMTSGYRLHLLFLWLPSPDLAVARVAERVRAGGHHVPEDVVRRRYNRGLKNFFEIYQPLATTWQVLHASVSGRPPVIARGRAAAVSKIRRPDLWDLVLRSAGK